MSNVVLFLIGLLFLLYLIIIFISFNKNFLKGNNITIQIDGVKISAQRGDTLLNVLRLNKIFIKSACGGGGSCKMCVCNVIEGNPVVKKVEKKYFTRLDLESGKRLACQVQVLSEIIVELND